MKKIVYIGLMSIGLVACSTVSTAPLDDAYYWDKPLPASTTQNTPIIQNTQSSPAPAPKQTVEYTNVQDTTVTIRIHK